MAVSSVCTPKDTDCDDADPGDRALGTVVIRAAESAPEGARTPAATGRRDKSEGTIRERVVPRAAPPAPVEAGRRGGLSHPGRVVKQWWATPWLGGAKLGDRRGHVLGGLEGGLPGRRVSQAGRAGAAGTAEPAEGPDAVPQGRRGQTQRDSVERCPGREGRPG